MRQIAIVALLALFASLVACDVLKLDSSSFDDTINTKDIALVKFFAPWCGHCKKLAPEYEKAAKTLEKDDSPVSLIEVDCDVEKDLCSRFGVSGFPTLKIFRNGKEFPYDGPRDADGIIKYMRSQAGPAARAIETIEAFEALIAKKDDVSIVGFFANEKDAKTFLDVAQGKRENFRFAIVTKKEIIEAKNGGKDGIVNFRPWANEKNVIAFEGALTSAAAIKAWVELSSIPVAGVYKKSVESRYAELGLPRLTVFAKVDEERDPAGTRYILNRLRKVAKDFEGKIVFVSQDNSAEIATELELKEGIAIFDGETKYKYDLPFSVDNVKKAAEDFLAGKLSPYLKSEPIPETRTPVLHVVGKNFDEEVMKAKEDVFIKFYAPWCGHCKSLAPKYEELAKKLSKNKTLKIVELDATANDYPKGLFSVHGFPTMYLLKANDKKSPVQYNGGREVDDMEKWLKSQVSQKLEL